MYWLLFQSNPYPLIQLAHSLWMCRSNRKGGLDRSQFWVKSLLMAILRSYGGGTVKALLANTLPPWLSDSRAFWTPFIAWIIIYQLPGDIGWKTVNENKRVLTVIAALEALAKARSITGSVDAGSALSPSSIFVPLLWGTLGGCGGTLLANIEQKSRGHTGPSSLDTPAYVPRMAFTTALLYYLATNPQKLLPVTLLNSTTARSLLFPVILGSYLIRVQDPSWDQYPAVFENFWYRITGIKRKVVEEEKKEEKKDK